MPALPAITALRVYVGTSSKIDQGTAPPLIRGVPGPVPFTIVTEWAVFVAGSYTVSLSITDSEDKPVMVAADGRWRPQQSQTQELSPGAIHEEYIILALIETGGVLHFRRLINGAVVAAADLEIEVEAAASPPP